MRLFATEALLPQGWRRNVRIDLGDDGTIARVLADAEAGDAERLTGPLVPGVANVHSHAFQRALAGRTGRRSATRDSFWTWREAMYAFLDRIDAEAFEAIAAQAYVEMLRAGYTSVAEFHYVHHDPRGNPYADPTELAQCVARAAAEAGIALTLLPVFYAHSGFGGTPPTAGQRRFVHTVDSFARLVQALAAQASAGGYTLGVAPHSLRAVTPDELSAVTALAPRGAPVHVHASEQAKEVADCLAWSGARPVEWLLRNAGVDGRWCVVHATHLTPEETGALAASGAVAGLASTTEADLGDGTFPARAYLDAGGAFGVGSDSNTKLDPFAELRQLEWSQRLAHAERNVLADDATPVGQAMYVRAAAGGARALGRKAGAIAPGSSADLLVLNVTDAALAGQSVDALLDAAIFGPCRQAVRDVMVGGRWVIRDGWHPGEDAVFARYAATMARMLG